MLFFGQTSDDDVTVTSAGARGIKTIDDVDRTTDFTVSVRNASIFTHSTVTSVCDNNDFIDTAIDLEHIALTV